MPKSITIDPAAVKAAEELPRLRADAAALEVAQVAAADEAEMAAETLTSRLTRGDSTVTASELVLARAEAERASLLRDAATREAKRLQRRNVPTDFAVAERAAEILHAEGLIEAPIVITATDPATPKSGLPKAYVTQRTHVSNTEGPTQASFDVALYSSSPHYRLPSAAAVQGALKAHHWDLAVTVDDPQEVATGVWLHRLHIDADHAFSGAPVVSGGDVSALHHGMPRWIAERTGLANGAATNVMVSLIDSSTQAGIATERWAVGVYAAIRTPYDFAQAAVRGALGGLLHRGLGDMGVVVGVENVGLSPVAGGAEVGPGRTDGAVRDEGIFIDPTPLSRVAVYAEVTTHRTVPVVAQLD